MKNNLSSYLWWNRRETNEICSWSWRHWLDLPARQQRRIVPFVFRISRIRSARRTKIYERRPRHSATAATVLSRPVNTSLTYKCKRCRIFFIFFFYYRHLLFRRFFGPLDARFAVQRRSVVAPVPPIPDPLPASVGRRRPSLCCVSLYMSSR